MTRSQRRWHVRIWLALGPLIALGLLAALTQRPPNPIEQGGPVAVAGRGSSAAKPSTGAEGGP